MKKFSISYISLVLSVLLVLTGCGSSDDVVPTTFISASPASGTTILTDATLTLTFDNMPENITVSEGTAVPSGNTVAIQGPFSLGDLSLVVTWDDDSVTLSYTVESPAVAFPDAALRTAVEEALGEDMPQLIHLDALRSGISDLTGIEYLQNLETLNLKGNAIADISPLAKLTKLKN